MEVNKLKNYILSITILIVIIFFVALEWYLKNIGTYECQSISCFLPEGLLIFIFLFYYFIYKKYCIQMKLIKENKLPTNKGLIIILIFIIVLSFIAFISDLFIGIYTTMERHVMIFPGATFHASIFVIILSTCMVINLIKGKEVIKIPTWII